MLPGYWPLEVAEEPIPFPNDNSVKSNNGGNELQRDEVKSADHKEERNTPVGGIFFFDFTSLMKIRDSQKVFTYIQQFVLSLRTIVVYFYVIIILYLIKEA